MRAPEMWHPGNCWHKNDRQYGSRYQESASFSTARVTLIPAIPTQQRTNNGGACSGGPERTTRGAAVKVMACYRSRDTRRFRSESSSSLCTAHTAVVGVSCFFFPWTADMQWQQLLQSAHVAITPAVSEARAWMRGWFGRQKRRGIHYLGLHS